MSRTSRFTSTFAVMTALVFTLGQALPIAYAAPLDTTPPVIQVVGVSDGAIYDKPVSPTVTSADPDLASLQVTLDGAVWVSGGEVGPGRHTLAALAIDTSGNPSNVSVFFIVDTMPPVLWTLSPVPTSVDVGLSARNVVYMVELSEDFSGIDLVRSGVELRSPGGQMAEVVGPLTYVSGPRLGARGVYSQTLRIPMGAEPGVWTTHAEFYDLAGHIHMIDTSDLLGFGATKKVFVSRTTQPVDRVDAAVVAVSPLSAAAGAPVSFTATATDSLGDAITSYEWSSSIGGVFGVSPVPVFASSGLPVGTNHISVRARCANGEWSLPASYSTPIVIRAAQTDFTAPTTSSNAAATYLESASITLIAYDFYGTGVAHTYFILDGGPPTEGTSVTTSLLGAHTLSFWSVDRAGNVEIPTVREFVVTALPVPAAVGTPIAPASVKHGSAFGVYGYVSPAHDSGTYLVTLYFYRYQSGHYVLRRTVKAARSEFSDTASRYSATVSLPYTGRWRVRAYHADSEHTGAFSGYRYITAK